MFRILLFKAVIDYVIDHIERRIVHRSVSIVFTEFMIYLNLQSEIQEIKKSTNYWLKKWIETFNYLGDVFWLVYGPSLELGIERVAKQHRWHNRTRVFMWFTSARAHGRLCVFVVSFELRVFAYVCHLVDTLNRKSCLSSLRVQYPEHIISDHSPTNVRVPRSAIILTFILNTMPTVVLNNAFPASSKSCEITWHTYW